MKRMNRDIALERVLRSIDGPVILSMVHRNAGKQEHWDGALDDPNQVETPDKRLLHYREYQQDSSPHSGIIHALRASPMSKENCSPDPSDRVKITDDSPCARASSGSSDGVIISDVSPVAMRKVTSCSDSHNISMKDKNKRNENGEETLDLTTPKLDASTMNKKSQQEVVDLLTPEECPQYQTGSSMQPGNNSVVPYALVKTAKSCVSEESGSLANAEASERHDGGSPSSHSEPSKKRRLDEWISPMRADYKTDQICDKELVFSDIDDDEDFWLS